MCMIRIDYSSARNHIPVGPSYGPLEAKSDRPTFSEEWSRAYRYTSTVQREMRGISSWKKRKQFHSRPGTRRDEKKLYICIPFAKIYHVIKNARWVHTWNVNRYLGANRMLGDESGALIGGAPYNAWGEEEERRAAVGSLTVPTWEENRAGPDRYRTWSIIIRLVPMYVYIYSIMYVYTYILVHSDDQYSHSDEVNFSLVDSVEFSWR